MSIKGYTTITINNRLLAADATRALIAAPGVGRRLVIVKLNWQSITAAAQPVDVGVSGGGVAQQVTSLPASLPVGANGGVNLGDGYEMPDNTALTALPGGAGPAVQFEIEYYVKITVLP